MVYRISAGIFLVLLSLSMFGTHLIPEQLTALFGFIAGVALLIGY